MFERTGSLHTIRIEFTKSRWNYGKLQYTVKKLERIQFLNWLNLASVTILYLYRKKKKTVIPANFEEEFLQKKDLMKALRDIFQCVKYQASQAIPNNIDF